MRRERGTSRRVTAKSISIKDAKRRSGDCARKAAELTSGDLAGSQKSAEGIVDLTSARLVRHSKAERWSQQIGQSGNGERRPERERSGE
jgi:hypothetical protein